MFPMESVAMFYLFLLLILHAAGGVPLVPVAQESLQFMVLADWGGADYHPYTTQTQIDVARQMALTAEERNISFVLSLGDNFYNNGVNGILSSRFETTFEQVYYQESLQIPWYIIAGNHDHYHSVKAQIRRSHISSRWNFPHFYHKHSWELPGHDKKIEIVLLDTTLLCGNTHDTPEGGKVVVGPDNVRQANLQWSWLEKSLEESTADYLLVGGHYPVYSVGVNGPTECLFSRLEPLLYENHVTAYFSGHDHNLQHLQTYIEEQTMNFFIVGGGAWSDDIQSNLHTVPKGSLKFFFGKNHVGSYALVDVTNEHMEVSFITSNGDVKYRQRLYPRK